MPTSTLFGMASTARDPNAVAGATTGRRTKPTSGPTRERLLAAARESFAKLGFASTRVADIVALAGTSHGTFYTYFDDKRDALLALTQEAASAIYGAAVAPLAGSERRVPARRDPRPPDGFLPHLRRVVGRCSDLGSRQCHPSRGRRAARAYQGIDRRAALPAARTRPKAQTRRWQPRPRDRGHRADRDGRGIRGPLVRAWPHIGDYRDRSADGAVRRSLYASAAAGAHGKDWSSLSYRAADVVCASAASSDRAVRMPSESTSRSGTPARSAHSPNVIPPA